MVHYPPVKVPGTPHAQLHLPFMQDTSKAELDALAADTGNVDAAAEVAKTDAATTATALLATSQSKSPTYTVRGLVEVAGLHLPPLEYLFYGIALIHGGVVEVIGSPGIGKSRFVADLARHQILGRDFCGFETLKTPKKWLFAGTENGIYRLNRENALFLYHLSPGELSATDTASLEAIAMKNELTPKDLASLDKNFKTFTLEDPEDYDISLLNEGNVAKLTTTLKEHRPDILVLDPWGDVIAGDELKDGDIRLTIRKCLANAGLNNTLLIIVNHARIGAKEEANARGTEAGNFGKNSKCLFSVARFVINIRRASFDENPPIEIICAKNNDGPKPKSFAAKLDCTSMSYNLLEGFNADEWQRELDKAAGVTRKAQKGLTDNEQQGLFKAILKIVERRGLELLTSHELHTAIRGEGYGKTITENGVAKALTDGILVRTPKLRHSPNKGVVKDGSRIVYGTPELVKQYNEKYMKLL